jgi:cytochrome c oxidase assembly factor CtaG
LSLLEDQQIGGLMMWICGGVVVWLVMTVVWFRYSVWDARSDAETRVPEAAYGSNDQ